MDPDVCGIRLKAEGCLARTLRIATDRLPSAALGSHNPPHSPQHPTPRSCQPLPSFLQQPQCPHCPHLDGFSRANELLYIELIFNGVQVQVPFFLTL